MMMKRLGRPKRPERAPEPADPPGAPDAPTATIVPAPTPPAEPMSEVDVDVGIPPIPVPFDVPPPEQIPPPAPDEKPDKADDTANVPLDVLVWLKSAKAVLLAEGFRREPLRQARKPGMVWGVIRQEPNDMQIHVRGFKDGRLESEVELSNRYVQHLWSHRRGAHAEVKAILSKHGMPTERVSETFLPVTGTKPGKIMPTGRTKTNHVVAAVLIGLAVIAGKAYLKRVILKRRR